MGLQGLQLAPNLVDGAVQLQHAIAQRPLSDRLWIAGLSVGWVGFAGAVLSAGQALGTGEPQEPTLLIVLAPAFRFAEQPPGQPGRAGNGTDQSA